ncbi:hypothetical protein N7492_007375 [Penicillium capsulatum]|uniref:Uncharacterized protein n=1 Tax=Penicillium capsulatum TaxID=69766 RepID=A0A9W9I1W0_9EURO|nr:hypothetical protein N7492_007375 [Penicillium capsulatum]KAJ6117215.1 hypothetical protein N7512_006940 [Penicillium capsulatum]
MRRVLIRSNLLPKSRKVVNAQRREEEVLRIQDILSRGPSWKQSTPSERDMVLAMHAFVYQKGWTRRADSIDRLCEWWIFRCTFQDGWEDSLDSQWERFQKHTLYLFLQPPEKKSFEPAEFYPPPFGA